jgi:hypothetical protein
MYAIYKSFSDGVTNEIASFPQQSLRRDKDK